MDYLVRKKEIVRYYLVENYNNDICVRFTLNTGEAIILPCFYGAGFHIGDMPDADEAQMEFVQQYLDEHSDDELIDLNSQILYDMEAYH